MTALQYVLDGLLPGPVFDAVVVIVVWWSWPLLMRWAMRETREFDTNNNEGASREADALNQSVTERQPQYERFT